MHLQSHPPSTAPQSKPRRVLPARRRLHPCRVPSGHPSSWHARGPAQPHRADDTATAAFREWFSTLVAPSDPRNNTAEKHRNGSKRDFLEARQVSLFQLFDGHDYKFDVPSYQRPYSWGIKQVHEMLQDFLASYHAKSEYFMGAIVTVRGEDGPGTAMQVIDGQQRLTSLLIMLAFVHAWAKEQNNENLEARIKRMLYLEPDVLDPSAKGRFRLELRQGDDTFFIRNMLEAWLPIQYNLSGVAALQAEATGIGHGAGRSGTGGSIGGDGKPLENESWWRMYENAAYMRSTLSEAVAGGLNLQDFMFHVLRNCHVVLMTARDEAASFRIFSTINSRGMDLTMVDKLKADVLEVLEPSQRRKYATAWSEMEDILGRTAFHRVFDHMRSLAIVVHPEVQHMSVLEYFSRQRQDPALVAATIGCALDYAHTLLQLKQCRFEVCPPDSHAQTLASPSGPATRSVPHQLLAADGHGGIVAAWDDGGPDSLVHTHGAVRMLERQARHMSLFSEDMWVPSTLDFFQQVQDMDLRTRFLQAAETLQLYLELCRDAGAAANRWQAVAKTIIQRDLKEQEHLQAIFNVLVLSQQEKAEFRLRLNAKDLIGSAPRRTLAHLLLRAEGCAVSTSPEINFSELHVEKVVPAAPPEGSLWRRIKLGGANGTPAPSEPLTTTHAAPQASTIIPTVPNGNGSGRSSRGPSSSRATSRASSASSTSAAKDSTSSGGSSGSPGGSPPAGTAAAGSTVLVGYSATARAGSRRRSPGGEGVKYWFEVQRLFWHGKLGNLILLPTTPAAASPALADADYDVKAAYYKSCGVEAVLPEWSGSVANGRYGRNRFSFEECKARHMDLHARLVEIFRLAEDDVEDPLEMEDEYWPDDSVY